MAEETARLTLAFIGEQEVHRNNARSLLQDFVEGWLKQHRKGEVKVILSPSDEDADVTNTMTDIDDWASTAGYEVIWQIDSLITELLEEPDARLILVGDPNDDETLYDVVEEAAKYRIQTRSLINGLEKVVFDDDTDLDDDLAGKEGFHEVDVESGEGWVEDDDLTDEAAAILAAVPDVEDAPDENAPPDLDLLATLADDGEVEAQTEITVIAATVGIDTAPFETWADAVAAIRGMSVTVVSAEQFEQLQDESPSDAEEEAEIEATITPAPADVLLADGGIEGVTSEEVDEYLATVRNGTTHDLKWTREELEAKSFDEVKAIALDHGIPPGRGMKHGVFVTKILLATGVETDAPKRTRKPKLKAVAEPEVAGAAEPASNIIPIQEVVQGHSLKEIADSLRHYADVLDPPEN